MILITSCPLFERKKLKNGKISKKYIIETKFTRNGYILCLSMMNFISILKGIMLIYVFITGKTPEFYKYFFNKREGENVLKPTDVLMEGGVTLIIESCILLFMRRCLYKFSYIALGVKECYFNLMKANSFKLFLARELLDYIAVFSFMIRLSWLGLALGIVISLALVINCPAFKKIAPPTYVTHLFICATCCFLLVTSLFFSTEEKLILDLGKEQIKYIGADLKYNPIQLFNNNLNLFIINIGFERRRESNLHIFPLILLVVISSYILSRSRLAALGEKYFEDEINDVMSKPPNTVFKGVSEREMKKIRRSFYINYFIKKISLIMEIDWRQGLSVGAQLNNNYLEDIPYLDKKKLAEKYKFYADFKHFSTDNSKFSFWRLFRLIKEAVANSVSLSNFVNILLLAWLVFFMVVKNDIPTYFTFFALISVGSLGIINFNRFLNLSQYLIVIPLFLNLTLTYATNIDGNPFNCDPKSTKFPCLKTIGLQRFAEKDNVLDSKLSLSVIFALFKFFTFLLTLLKISDHLFKEKSKNEMIKEIDESFSKGQVPLIKIVLVRIASKMYLICYFLMIFVGTRGANITSMILLTFFLIFVSSKRLISENWNIFYFSLNIIVIGGFMLDLILSETTSSKEMKEFIKYVGLPSNLNDNQTIKDPNVRSLTSKQFLFLYICCLIQQIASSNLYIRIYMTKVSRINDKKSMITILRKFFRKFGEFWNQVYYKYGIWVAYILNICCSMTLSITVGRCVLLVFQFYIMICHLEALRKANISGHLDLRKVLKLWNLYFLVKIFVLVMMLTGTFIMNKWIRTKLGIDDDDLDFEILNYLGIENLEPDTIEAYPNLNNCSGNKSIYQGVSKLLWYFLTEGIMFISSRTAITITRIQMVYFDNIHGFLRSEQRNILLKLKKKPKLYRIFKIYHKYILGSLKGKSDKLKVIDEIVTFIARIYTTVIYFMVLFTSIYWDKICLLIFTYLVYFFLYFLRINKTFLNYIEREEVEDIVNIQLDYFYEKYLSESALQDKTNKYDKALENKSIAEEDEPKMKYKYQEIKRYLSKNLLILSVKLRLKISKFEIENKNKIYWASVLVSVFIINLSYISGLIEYFPYFTRKDEGKVPEGLAMYRTLSRIIGIDFKVNSSQDSGGICFASNMFPFVVLFFFSSADVYVMKLISSLQTKLAKELEQLELVEEEEQEEMRMKAEEEDYSDDSDPDSLEGGGSEENLRSMSSESSYREDNIKKLQRLDDLGKMYPEEEKFGLDQSSISSIEDEDENGRIIDKKEKKEKEAELIRHEEYEEDLDYDTFLKLEKEEISKESSKKRNSSSGSSSSSGSGSDEGKSGSELDVDQDGFKKNKLNSLGIELLNLDKVKEKTQVEKNYDEFIRRRKQKKNKKKKKIKNKAKKRIWNFTEFYLVSEHEEDQAVRDHIAYKTMLKAKNLSSDSSDQSSEESEQKSTEECPNMEESKDHIITFYYKNMAKYNKIKMWKSIMEITQKIVAALLILILLFKTSVIVILLYLLYIIYFYRDKTKNVKTLQITANFLVIITLLQYLGLLLGQKVVVNNNKETEIWKYFYQLLTGNKSEADLKVIGIYNTKGSDSVIYDAIPTIFFQLIIFTYDIFLFTVSRAVQYTIVKVRSIYYFQTRDYMGRKVTLVDYKKWKEVMYKALQTFLNVMYVRINEIVITVQLTVNILSPSDSVWNIMRLLFIVVYFSMIGFKPMSEFRLVRKRIKKILFFLMIFIWARVLLGKVFEIVIQLGKFYLKAFGEKIKDDKGKENYNGLGGIIDYAIQSIGTVLKDQFNPEGYIKLMIVIELFLIELVYSLYHEDSFLEKQEKIIKKKVIRSKLISICMSYEQNESKLMGVISGYQEKIKLAKEIKKINGRIQKWKKYFQSGGKAKGRSRETTGDDPEMVALAGNAEKLKEQNKLKIKEQIHRLVQTSPTMVKFVFGFYKLIRYLTNKFMFMNIMSLYDHICHRNNEIVMKPNISLRNYLSNDFKIIEYNVKCINNIYKAYSNEVKRTKAKKFNRNRILEKKRNIMKSSRDENFQIFDMNDSVGKKSHNASLNKSREQLTEKQKKRKRGSEMMKRIEKEQRNNFLYPGGAGNNTDRNLDTERKKDKEAIEKNRNLRNFHDFNFLLKRFKKYDYKVVKIDTKKKIKFYKMLLGNEILTQEYSTLHLRVTLNMFMEMLISNWHNICYIAMSFYCFINGGLSGFFYIFLIVTFVLIEEGYPSLIFWRLSFFNSCISVFMKQLVIDFYVKKQISDENNNPYLPLQISYLILGDSSYTTDCFILIMILIQLILLDEIGLKKSRANDLEDTSTAFVRMRLNKVFEMLYNDKFETYEMYLKALNNASKKMEDKQWEDDKKPKRMDQLKSSRRPGKKGNKDLKFFANKIRSGLKGLKGAHTMKLMTDRSEATKGGEIDKIDMKGILAFERAERLRQFKSLRGTARNIDGIFLSSFSKLSEKNTKSFLWQNFSIYTRKPGLDLSPLITISLFLLTIYSAMQINKLQGESRGFMEQVLVSESVSSDIIICFLMGILMLVIERMIYKSNPAEWRENYEIQRFSRKPLTVNELQFCIREQIEKGVETKDINWDKLNIKKENRLKKFDNFDDNENEMIEEERDEEEDKNYKKNPLLRRYYYLIFILFLMIMFSWIFFPIMQNIGIIGSFECPINPKSKDFTDTKCSFFQKDVRTQGFFGIFLIYAVLSALQIRYGEPITKGKRVIMTRTDDDLMTKILYLANMGLRKTPFFFYIATMLDYMLTPTAIDFWEWVKFESIYEALYLDIYKMNGRDKRIPGIKIKRFPMKYIFGIFGSIIQVGIILYPFLKFGNYSQKQNDVTDAQINIDLEINLNKMNLYSNRYVKSIQEIDKSQYVTWFQSSGSKTIAGYQLSSIQVLTFYERSSRVFSPTIKSLEEILERLMDDKAEKKIVVTATFSQQGGNIKKYEQKIDLESESIKKFVKTFSLLRNLNGKNNRITKIQSRDFYIDFTIDGLIKIPNINAPFAGQKIESMLVPKSVKGKLPGQKNPKYIIDIFKIPISFKLLISESDYLDGFKDIRWNAQANNPFSTKFGENDNIFLITVVDDSPRDSSDNQTILSTYTSLVFVLGSTVAAILTIIPETIWTIDLPEAGQIIQICEAIVIARSDEKLDEERRLFYQLIDLIRSPELIKSVTRDYDEHVALNRAKHTKEQVWVMKRRMYLEMLKKAKEEEKKKLKEAKLRLKTKNLRNKTKG